MGGFFWIFTTTNDSCDYSCSLWKPCGLTFPRDGLLEWGGPFIFIILDNEFKDDISSITKKCETRNTYSEPTLLNQNILIKYRMYYRKSGRQIDPPTFTSEDENTYCCVAKGSNLISGRADRSVFLALYLGKCLGQLKANKALYKPIILISQA